MRADKYENKGNKKTGLFVVLIIAIVICLGCIAAIFTANYMKAHNTDENQTIVEPSQGEAAKQESDESKKPYVEERAEAILSEMSTWEKVCQMFIVTPENLIPYDKVTEAGPKTEAAIKDYPVGGLMYSKQNLVSQEQTKALVANTKSFSEIGLFISVDEEGGNVSRLMSTFGGTVLKPMYTYKDEGTDTAESNAYTIGEYIKEYGFNTDFAPVADVWSNPSNKVIGTRAYSDSFEQAAQLIPAAIRGFHKAGVICTLKHFPGHGNTSEDSHTSDAYVNKSKAELESQEWLPFKAGIAEGADMVMVGHLIVPEIDSVPATVSKAITTGILREELGFNGVIITDGLKMKAVSERYTPAELCINCINAGADILLDPYDFEAAAKGVFDAVDRGEITEERLNESVRRILRVKLSYGIIE